MPKILDETDDLPDWEFFSDRVRSHWRRPRTFTAFIPVQDGVTFEQLQHRLEQLNERFQSSLRQVKDLHSFRLGAIESDESTGQFVSVLFNTVHDDSPGKHLRSLVAHVGELLSTAFGLNSAADRSGALSQLILSNRVRENTFYVGSINATVAEIFQERQLKGAVQAYILEQQKNGRWEASATTEQIRRDVRDQFLTIPAGLPRERRGSLTAKGRWLRFLDLLATLILFPFIGVLAVDINAAIRRNPQAWSRNLTWLAYSVWWVYGAIPTAAGFLVSRLLELTEQESVAEPPDEALVNRLEVAENLGSKNAVTILFEVKNSWIRRWYLWMILRGAELGCRHVWTNGKLTGIGTIHHARIIQTPGGRRLLFMSDYDGSLNRYLDDFLSVGSRAVIPFTSNLVGCPRTRWLFQMHNKNNFGPRWKGMIRSYQVFTVVWYHSYPDLTVREILDHAAFREELFSESLSIEQADRWARRL